MERSLSLMRSISRWGLWFGGALVLLAAILIGVDVILRKFFTTSIGGADELAGYALAIGTAWGWRQRCSNARISASTTLYVMFPRLYRIILDFLGLALFIFFFAMVAWHGSGVRHAILDVGFAQPIRPANSHRDTAIDLDHRLVAVRCWLASRCSLDALVKLKAGDRAGIGRTIGIRSAEEDVEEEIAALKRRQRMEGSLMLGTTPAILLVLLGLAVPVAAGLGILGLILAGLYSTFPLSLALGEVSWATSNNFLLVAIPFFVLLGEILLRSGMAERMYNALVLWMPWLPGGLMHANIVACAMFAATSGSSVATAATIGTVAHGRDRKARIFRTTVSRARSPRAEHSEFLFRRRST